MSKSHKAGTRGEKEYSRSKRPELGENPRTPAGSWLGSATQKSLGGQSPGLDGGGSATCKEMVLEHSESSPCGQGGVGNKGQKTGHDLRI